MQELRMIPTFIPLQLLLVFLSVHDVISVLFQPVSRSCIYWDPLNIYSNGQTEKLHCIMDEQDQLGIVNTTWKLLPTGYCPYFDQFSDAVHAKPCDDKLGRCPEQPIYSYQAVKYSACYRANERRETTLNTQESGAKYINTPCTLCANYISFLIALTILSVLILLAIIPLHIYRHVVKTSNMETGRVLRGTDEEITPLTDVRIKESKGDGDGPELMHICLGLVRVQFLEGALEVRNEALKISEDNRETIQENLQKALNALSLNPSTTEIILS